MDYEKKYKEALERAEDFKNGIVQFALDPGESIVHYIFPELRESEDERIMKELIEFIKWSVDRHFMREDFHQAKRPSEWIAYLEKQKEYHIPWYDYQKSKEAGYTIVPNEEYEQLIKQKEQKPAWREDDEKMRYFVTEAVQSRYSDRELAKYLDPKIINEKKKLKQKLFDWLRDLSPHWKPRESQIKALEYVVSSIPPNYLKEQEYMMKLIGQVIQQLKKL